MTMTHLTISITSMQYIYVLERYESVMSDDEIACNGCGDRFPREELTSIAHVSADVCSPECRVAVLELEKGTGSAPGLHEFQGRK